MIGRFAVDPQELQTTATFLKDAAESYQRIYTELMNVAGNMGAAYDSEDNRAFVEKIHGCTGELRAMAERLEQTADILMQQKTNYERQTEANISAVRRL